jgi:hypothetical protein
MINRFANKSDCRTLRWEAIGGRRLTLRLGHEPRGSPRRLHALVICSFPLIGRLHSIRSKIHH